MYTRTFTRTHFVNIVFVLGSELDVSNLIVIFLLTYQTYKQTFSASGQV
jgi:hypothetical protein